MRVVTLVLRWIVGTLLSLVLLYCGAGIIMGIVTGKILPPFPFSWVDWLNRPNIPALADHVINFLLASMVATLFKDMLRHKTATAGARGNGNI